ncbi:MAG: hypothetical protein HYV65_02220 [Candidatus Spechtbacteria bacterium]|nr:hypothetical protein [Candidatus Spechtbacteria bacterium]
MKQEKFIIVFAIIAFVVIMGYGAWKFFGANMQQPENLEETQASPQKESSAAAPYGTLPGIESTSNPLQNVPELTPTQKTNPFKDAIKNPFE